MKIKITLVPGASQLWRAWSVQAAIIGAALPDALQLIADNSMLLPWFDASTKDSIRLGALLLILLFRPIKQNIHVDR